MFLHILYFNYFHPYNVSKTNRASNEIIHHASISINLFWTFLLLFLCIEETYKISKRNNAGFLQNRLSQIKVALELQSSDQFFLLFCQYNNCFSQLICISKYLNDFMFYVIQNLKFNFLNTKSPVKLISFYMYNFSTYVIISLSS